MSLTISPARIVEESRSPLLAAPDSWPRRRLSEVATVLNGFAFKSSQFATEGGVPLIRIRDISKEETVVNYLGAYDERYLVRKGELLVGMDGDFNAARWAGPRALLNQRVCKITPDPTVLDLDYLTVVLPGYLQAIHDYTSSTTVTHLSSKDIAEIPLPVPTLDKQRSLAKHVRSVRSIERNSATHLVSGGRAVGRFRQSLLAAACSGRLTADWRNSIGRIEAADSIIQTIESRRRLTRKNFKPSATPDVDVELPEGWLWTTVGALVDIATGATPLRARSDYYGGSIPWVTSGAVNTGLITQASEYITELALEETNAKVFPKGTLLVAMYGEGQTRGRVAELGIPAATNQAVAALLFDEVSACLRAYLRIFFCENYERIRQLSFGGVQPNLSLGVIRNMAIPLPPLVEQREIVRQVERLSEIAESIRVHGTQASRRLDQMLPAVLAKAFRGDLTVTNLPTLGTGA